MADWLEDLQTLSTRYFGPIAAIVRNMKSAIEDRIALAAGSEHDSEEPFIRVKHLPVKAAPAVAAPVPDVPTIKNDPAVSGLPLEFAEYH
jgi:hypothetical protein